MLDRLNAHLLSLRQELGSNIVEHPAGRQELLFTAGGCVAKCRELCYLRLGFIGM